MRRRNLLRSDARVLPVQCPHLVDNHVDQRGYEPVRHAPELQVSDAADVWTQVTLSLRSQLAESVWFSTFQDLTPLESDTDTLRLMAPSAYVRDRIMTRYLPLVTEALHDANEGQRNVEIDVAANESAVDELDETHRQRRRSSHERARISATRSSNNGNGTEPARTNGASETGSAEPARRSRPEPALHVRDVRQGRVEPVRARRRAPGRRDTGPQLQPAVHLRLGRASARPTSCTPSVTTCTRTTSTTRCATSRPRRS